MTTLGIVILLAATHPQASQVNCRSYLVGTVLYTSCNGEPGRPAGGIDPSIPLGVKPVQIQSPADWMLKAEQLRLLRQQSELLEAQRQTLAAPAVAAATPPPPSAAPLPDLSGPIDGAWWAKLQALVNAGVTNAQATRSAYISGVMGGVDLLLLGASSSFEDYQARRARYFRDDLSLAQVIAKIDGYFAEPANSAHTVSMAVLSALKPLKQDGKD